MRIARSLILAALLSLGMVSLVSFADSYQSTLACDPPADPPKRK